MTTEPEKQEIAPWKPAAFAGSDLLPVLSSVPRDRSHLVGRDNVEQSDLVLPTLRLLQGMSPPVLEGVEGAIPGRFMDSASQQVFTAPLRLLFVAHTKSNALYLNPKDARYNGLQKCISRDAITGSVYGACEECGKCTEWVDNQKPLGAQSHNFVVMTDQGPAILRCSRTSFTAAKQFVSTWMMSDKNLWAHPVVVRVKAKPKQLEDGRQTTYFSMEPTWQRTETTPPEVQALAMEWHKMVMAAHGSGKLRTDEEGGDDNPF
jgi:hypothetical protein